MKLTIPLLHCTKAMTSWRFMLALFAISMVHAGVTNAAQIEWTSTTQAQPWKQRLVSALKVADVGVSPQIFIRTNKTYQTIDGFGGSFNELGWVALSRASHNDSQKVLEALFGKEGANFNLARIPIGASDFALDGYSLDDVHGDYALKHFSVARDKKHLLPYIKAAMNVRPDLKAWASPWSPPAWMKDNSSYSNGSLRWEPKILDAYANYFIKWVAAYRAQGVNIYAITPQNEPNILNVYPTAKWTAPQLSEFIGDYLGPTLQKKNINVEVWLGLNGDPPNDGDNINDRLTTVMENNNVSEYITGIGFQYDSKIRSVLPMSFIRTRSLCSLNLYVLTVITVGRRQKNYTH